MPAVGIFYQLHDATNFHARAHSPGVTAPLLAAVEQNTRRR
jgi:hypothetical protein